MHLYKQLIGLVAVGILTACGSSTGSGGSSTPLLSSAAVSSASVESPSSAAGLSSSMALVSSSAASAVSSVLPTERTKAHALWSFDSKARIRSTAVISDDLVIFGTEAGKLYALDRSDGSERWSLATGGAISSALALADGKVIFLNFSGKIMAVDARLGTQSWSISTGSEHYRSWGHHLASALVADGRVYIGSSAGKVYSLLPATGEQVWSIDLKSPVHTIPFLLDGILYVSSDSGVHAIDIATEKQLWSRTLLMPTAPAVGSGTLVVGSRQALVHGLDSSDGTDRWTVSHGAHWVTGGPVIRTDHVYIGSSDDHRYQSIELATGKVKWRVGMAANVFSTPAFNEGVSYISSGNSYADTGNGVVRAVDSEGNILWSFSGKNFFSSPIADDNAVFIGSDDGFFYALPAN